MICKQRVADLNVLKFIIFMACYTVISVFGVIISIWLRFIVGSSKKWLNLVKQTIVNLLRGPKVTVVSTRNNQQTWTDEL